MVGPVGGGYSDYPSQWGSESLTDQISKAEDYLKQKNQSQADDALQNIINSIEAMPFSPSNNSALMHLLTAQQDLQNNKPLQDILDSLDAAKDFL